MCNLSEVMLERGEEKGEELKVIAQVCKKMQKGKTVAEIADELEESEDTIKKIYEVALEHNANLEDKELIYKELH